MSCLKPANYSEKWLQMLKILKKIVSFGPIWFLKRIRLALLSPATKVGNRVKLFFYYLVHPIAFILNICSVYLSINFRKDKTLNVVYDLNFSAISFDFSYFLAGAEAFANMHNKTEIYLWIIRPNRENSFLSRIENSEYQSVVNNDSQDWRITNMIVPIANISPSVVNYSVVKCGTDIKKLVSNNLIFPEGYSSFHKPFPSFNYLFNILAKYDFRGFKSSDQAKIYVKKWLESMNLDTKIISITIRDYGFDKSRNSDFQSWVDFSDYLERQGFTVIFIPDMENCWDFKYKDTKRNYFSEICWNLELRNAFYEICDLNYFYSSGLASIATLNKNTKAISMTPLIEDSIESTAEIIKSYNPDSSDNPYRFHQDYQWTLLKLTHTKI